MKGEVERVFKDEIDTGILTSASAYTQPRSFNDSALQLLPNIVRFMWYCMLNRKLDNMLNRMLLNRGNKGR